MTAAASRTRQIDELIARALREGDARWPFPADDPRIAGEVADRLVYHGVAGLLLACTGPLASWPAEVLGRVRAQAVGQAMWEMRHRIQLALLLEALAARGIRCLLLKGTAIAYDLYAPPASRSRGDSDVLIDPLDLEVAREVLAASGFQRTESLADPVEQLQEEWSIRSEDGLRHCIDVHVSVFNALTLAHVLPNAELFAASAALPEISPHAERPGHAHMLFHACIHRAIHELSPYYSADVAYLGGDRLIWLHDIDLLVRTLEPGEWRIFLELSARGGVGGVCLQAIERASDRFGTRMPAEVRASLAASSRPSREARFLTTTRSLGRRWHELGAIRGLRRKLGFACRWLLPSRANLLIRFPHLRDASLVRLHLHRYLTTLKHMHL